MTFLSGQVMPTLTLALALAQALALALALTLTLTLTRTLILTLTGQAMPSGKLATGKLAIKQRAQALETIAGNVDETTADSADKGAAQVSEIVGNSASGFSDTEVTLTLTF